MIVTRLHLDQCEKLTRAKNLNKRGSGRMSHDWVRLISLVKSGFLLLNANEKDIHQMSHKRWKLVNSRQILIKCERSRSLPMTKQNLRVDFRKNARPHQQRENEKRAWRKNAAAHWSCSTLLKTLPVSQSSADEVTTSNWFPHNWVISSHCDLLKQPAASLRM